MSDQKIFSQALMGGLASANMEAKYTWEKGEIAWVYDIVYLSVSKVEFTGKRWLAGSKWRYRKIYQFKRINSSCSSQTRLVKYHPEDLAHSEEKNFFCTKKAASRVAKKVINRRLFEQVKTHDSRMTELKEYGELDE